MLHKQTILHNTHLLLQVLCFILVLSISATFVSAEEAFSRNVVVYTTVDQVFSEPVLKAFTEKYGIRVQAVYDIEAVKTTGLVNRLIAERNNPRCDVFWNSEILRTILLQRKGILAPYRSQQAKDIPVEFKDPLGYWTGFAGRNRVFVVNRFLMGKDNPPSSLDACTTPRWQGKLAMANPLFGTTATYLAAIFSARGLRDGTRLLNKLKRNGIKIVDGNAVVRDMAGAGEILIGLTDSDDVAVGKAAGLPIESVYPDNDDDALLIPNTVAIVHGAPHRQEAMKLVDYLLSATTEQQLIGTGFASVPLHGEYKKHGGHKKGPPDNLRSRSVTHRYDYGKMANVLPEALRVAQHIFMN